MTEEGINIPPQEYGVFGDATAAAVKAYQEKYGSDILVPQQMNEGNGILGKATRAKLNSTYGCAALNRETMAHVILKVNNVYLDQNGVTATFCNNSPSDIPSFPVRLRVNGIIRDFDIIGAKKAGACVTQQFSYGTWGLNYDSSSVFGVVILLDPLSLYKNASVSFPFTASSTFSVPVFFGPSLAVRSISIKTSGIQGTFCNVGTIDLKSFPVSISVNGASSTLDVPNAYIHGTCATPTWPYSTWGITYATGTTYSVSVVVNPNDMYNEVDTSDNAASVIGTP